MKEDMRMDEDGLVIINPVDAEPMIKDDPDVAEALLITTWIKKGEAILISEKDFKEFLDKHGQYFSKE